jgi:hypothetical protein
MQEKNILAQPDKFKWRDNPPFVSGTDMHMALTCAAKSDDLKCDCWNTKCANFGDCRKCIVYEMCLNQLPTCQMELFDELKEHHKKHSAEANA